jgi:hypothetical protein
MRRLLHEIDQLLRGEFTRRESLSAGRIAGRASSLLAGGLLLSAVYGLCMGLFAALRHPEGLVQIVYTTAKVPMLFFFTLAVTAPSLYVFSALARSRLRAAQTLVLLLACTAVTTAVLASLGPVTVFFTLSTKSHPFMQILNVVVFAIAGLVGVGFLRKVVAVVFEGERVQRASEVLDPGEAGARVTFVQTDPGAHRARTVFAVWILIYGVVGAQMGWILRPFVGAPGRPLEFLRATESNIFQGILEALRYL